MPLHNFAKISLLLGLAFGLLLHTSAQLDDLRLDSTYSFSFTSANDSVPLGKQVCTFSNLGNTNQCYNFSSCVNSDWVSVSRTWAPQAKFDTRTEDEGRKRTTLFSTWQTGTQSWRPMQRTFRLKVDELEEYQAYEWDTVAVDWVLSETRNYTFDAQGNYLSNETKYYNQEGKAWQGSQETRGFDDDNREIAYTFANWDEEEEDWKIEQNYTQSYTAAGQIAERISYYWDTQTESWQQGSVETYSYNADNNITRLEINSGGSRRIDEYTYNDQGLETFFERSYQFNSFSEIQAEERRSQTYDDVGNLLVREFYRWNFDSMLWEIQSRVEHSYNELNQLIFKKEYRKDFFSRLFYLQEETSYGYTSSGKEARDQRINLDEDGVIINGQRTTYEYDTQDRIFARITASWDGISQDWVLKRKSEFPSDANGRTICYASYVWDPQAQAWSEGSKTGLDYNDAGKVIRTYRAFWSPQQNDWFTTTSVNYHYGDCQKENLLQNRSTALQIYPNPAVEPLVFIETELQSPVRYEVMDFQGRKVLAGEMEALVNPIDLKGLVNGTYFIRCTSGDRSEIRKFVVAIP